MIQRRHPRRVHEKGKKTLIFMSKCGASSERSLNFQTAIMDKPVDSVGSIFYCEICGNEVIVTKVGGGTLYCCGKPMKKTGTKNDFEVDEEKDEDEE